MIEQKYKESFYESFLWMMAWSGITQEDVEFPDELEIETAVIFFSHFCGKEGVSLQEGFNLLSVDGDVGSENILLGVLKEVHEERVNG